MHIQRPAAVVHHPKLPDERERIRQRRRKDRGLPERQVAVLVDIAPDAIRDAYRVPRQPEVVIPRPRRADLVDQAQAIGVMGQQAAAVVVSPRSTESGDDIAQAIRIDLKVGRHAVDRLRYTVAERIIDVAGRQAGALIPVSWLTSLYV